MPERPTLDGLEAKWSAAWERERDLPLRSQRPARAGVLDRHAAADGQRLAARRATCSPTPTPTRSPATSGCAGREVFYPMGWDDNGLPTERRVQNHFGVRCDPSVPYDPDFSPPAEPSRARAGRRCRGRTSSSCACALTESDEQAFEELWRTLGLSVDWSMTYTTIGDARPAHLPALVPRPARARRGLPARGADAVGRGLPDRRRPGRARGPRAPGRDAPRALSRGRCADAEALIETTRPELIPACVALLAHPEDERHRGLVGREALTPLFGTRVPVLTHPAGRAREGHRAW